jgi:predicted nucleotidyltransferase
MGAISVYLFGSVLRGDQRSDSDIDLFFDYDNTQGFSLIELARLQRYVGTVLGTDVDLMTRRSLHPLIRRSVEESAQRVF